MRSRMASRYFGMAAAIAIGALASGAVWAEQQAQGEAGLPEQSAAPEGQTEQQQWYYIMPMGGDDMCLGVAGGSDEEGAPLVQTECDQGDDQKFWMTPGGDDNYQMRPGHSGMCIEVEDGSDDDGAPVVQSECEEGDDQKFWMEPTDGHGGYYRIHPEHSDKCLEVDGDSDEDGAPVVQEECNGGERQRFSFGN